MGAEIVISGKLRTERARYEKFKAGYLPKCGEPPTKYMRRAVVHVQMKPGMFGVRVRIMPPDAQFPDKIKIAENVPQEEASEEKAEAQPAEKKLEEKSEEKGEVEGEEVAG